MRTLDPLFSINEVNFGAKRTMGTLFTKKHREVTVFPRNNGINVLKHKELAHFTANNGTGVRQVQSKQGHCDFPTKRPNHI